MAKRLSLDEITERYREGVKEKREIDAAQLRGKRLRSMTARLIESIVSEANAKIDSLPIRKK